MKKTYKFIAVLSFLFLFSFVASAQKVYSCEYKSDADVKVYVATYKSDADLVVYKCNYQSDATDNKGLWYFCNYKSDAKKENLFLRI